MLNLKDAVEIIRDLNDLAPAGAFGNHEVPNIEYFKGQVELIAHLVGWADTDHPFTDFLVTEALGVTNY